MERKRIGLKRVVALLLSLSLMLGVCGCGKTPNDGSEAPVDGTQPGSNTDGIITEKVEIAQRELPILAWSSWNGFEGSKINKDGLVAELEAMVTTGLADVGYNYFLIDDGYQYSRDAKTGRLQVDPKKFPGGWSDMKYIADLAHSKGLYAGIYTDAGDDACSAPTRGYSGKRIGLYGHDVDDLHMYLGEGIYRDTYAQNNPDDPGIECWGYDFIKVDWCGGVKLGLDQQTEYTKVSKIIEDIEQEVKEDRLLNICCWAYLGEWQAEVGDSWRIGGDVDMRGGDFESVLVQVDNIKPITHMTGPGRQNDADALVVGKKLTQYQDETQFGLWCMFSSPIMIGCKLTTIRPETLELLSNTELLALNQDPAVLCASFEGAIQDNVEVWVKDLGKEDSPTKAVALFNRTDKVQTVTYSISDAGYTEAVSIRDLYAHKDLGKSKTITVTLQPWQTRIYKLNSEAYPEITDADETSDSTTEGLSADSTYGKIDGATARQLVSDGAVLLDVRTEEEYEQSHLDRAVNVLYTSVVSQIADVIPDKNKSIVCYCSAGKRSAQAYNALKSMGYTNVYNLGSMSNYT